MIINDWAEYHALAEELAETPSCGHAYLPGGPRRGCAWCELSEAMAHYENAAARRARHAVPNSGGRS